MIQEFGQFSRESLGRIQFKSVGGIVHNSCLGSVGNHKPQGIDFSQTHIFFIFVDGIYGVCNTCHHSVYNLSLTVYVSAERYGILTVLLMEVIQISEFNRLNQNNISVKLPLFVGNINHVIHKSPEEISLSELNYLNRPFLFSGHCLV